MPNEVEGIDQLNKALDNVPRGLVKNLTRIINLNSVAMQRYIREERLTGGTTATRLRSRSNRLRGSVITIKAEEKDNTIKGGVSIGTRYAKPHFGKPGEMFTIKAKGKWLTIPIDKAHGGVLDEDYEGSFPALMKSGISKGGAKTGPWGNTFVKKSQSGNLIIWGQMRISKGQREGQLRSQIVPLFLLRQQVKIPARIDPDSILNWISPKVIKDLKESGLRVNE